MTAENAAENLAGMMLDTGWFVRKRIDKQPSATGSFFSVCYTVERGGEVCFLKAFNFARFLQLSEGNAQRGQLVNVISEMLEAYRYERDLSAMCRDHHVTKVVFVKDSGEQVVPGYAITLVPYLVFDLADGDVRSKLTFSSTLDTAWRLHSLHSVAVGMQQLHAISVSHQDLKPSNVLLIQDESKIGDLGRSTCSSIPSPLKDLAFAGDRHYAPPEVLYGAVHPDWQHRSFSADCYLFGSLIVFYFSGITMNALLRRHLPDAVSWERYQGSFSDVAAYLLEAFAKALDDFEAAIPEEVVRKDLREMVDKLCHPLPDLRGDPKRLGLACTQYGFERCVTQLDLLRSRARIELSRRHV